MASCTVGTAEVEEGYATVKMEEYVLSFLSFFYLRETEEKPVVFGALGDVNLRSGKVIEKFDQDDVVFTHIYVHSAILAFFESRSTRSCGKTSRNGSFCICSLFYFIW